MSARLFLGMVVSCLAFLVVGLVSEVSRSQGYPPCNGKKVQDDLSGKCGQGSTCPAYNASTNPNCSGTMVDQENEVARCVSGGLSTQYCEDYKNPDDPEWNRFKCTQTFNCKKTSLGTLGFLCEKGTPYVNGLGEQVASYVYGGIMRNCEGEHHGPPTGHDP